MVASTPMATITTVSMLPGGSVSPGQCPSGAEAGKTQGEGGLVKQQLKSGSYLLEGGAEGSACRHLRA